MESNLSGQNNSGINTLELANDLRASGFSKKQSEILANKINQITEGDLVTKGYLDTKLKNFAAEEKLVTKEYLDARLKEFVVEEQLVTKEYLDMRMAEIDMKFKDLEQRMTIKLGGMLIVAVGIFATLTKVL